MYLYGNGRAGWFAEYLQMFRNEKEIKSQGKQWGKESYRLSHVASIAKIQIRFVCCQCLLGFPSKTPFSDVLFFIFKWIYLFCFVFFFLFSFRFGSEPGWERAWPCTWTWAWSLWSYAFAKLLLSTSMLYLRASCPVLPIRKLPWLSYYWILTFFFFFSLFFYHFYTFDFFLQKFNFFLKLFFNFFKKLFNFFFPIIFHHFYTFVSWIMSLFILRFFFCCKNCHFLIRLIDMRTLDCVIKNISGQHAVIIRPATCWLAIAWWWTW